MYERPGYILCPFVEEFLDTPVGPVPRVATTASRRDVWGTVGARIGFLRTCYKVVPGLYAVGTPGREAPVLVTANYKLSFDALRCSLADVDAWLLVVDTRGINVWCAAGKGTFSSEEVVRSVEQVRLSELVTHREMILPQLAATGVAGRVVHRRCGFAVRFGPVRSADLREFLRRDKQCDEAMRTVTFPLAERAVLIPVELFLLAKPLLLLVIVALVFSGISPSLFSLAAAFERGGILLAATGMGIIGGAVCTPLFLPWLPGRQFWLKGLTAGLPGMLWLWWWVAPGVTMVEQIALMLWVMAISSYLAMNFTGSTPFTSPSGVEHEMRRGLVVQMTAAVVAMILWLSSPFC